MSRIILRKTKEACSKPLFSYRLPGLPGKKSWTNPCSRFTTDGCAEIVVKRTIDHPESDTIQGVMIEHYNGWMLRLETESTHIETCAYTDIVVRRDKEIIICKADNITTDDYLLVETKGIERWEKVKAVKVACWDGDIVAIETSLKYYKINGITVKGK